MTAPTGPPGPYQMPPAQPAVPASGKHVSPAGYWIGGGILLVGCGAALIWFVVAIVGLVDAPDHFERIRVPGSQVVTLDEGDWTIYYESTVDRGYYSYGLPSVDVTAPNGRDISVQYSDETYSYTVNGNHGEAVYEFHASSPGAYTIEASTVGEPGLGSGDRIAIGRPLFSGGRIASIVGSIALGAVSFLAGLVVLIVTIVRRGRSRRRPAYAPYQPPYGGGPPGATPYAGPYAGGQYGAPGPGGPAPPGPPAPNWPPPAPGSSPWPVPGTTPPSPDQAPRPAPGTSPWPAPDERPRSD